MIQDNQAVVCRRCGTLNDSRSLMCVRCGNGLENTEEKKYEILKNRLISGVIVAFLFVLLFLACLYGVIFYVMPWIEGKLILFGESFVFEYYNNPTLTYVVLEAIYTLTLSMINYFTTIILLEIIIGSKILKANSVRKTNLFICLLVLTGAIGMTYYKYGLDYVVMIEHLVSVIVIMSYIKKKLFKRSA